MARTIETIQKEIIDQKRRDPVLAGLSSESATAIWRLWTYVLAVAIWTLEMLFDSHREEMEKLYTEHHAHTLEWYNTRAKGFMKGKQPLPFSWKYDTTGMSAQDIKNAQIITHASCTKAREANNKLVLELKVATGESTNRKPLDSLTELVPFREYMERSVQDAGLDLVCISEEADRLKMRWTIYYDPQILDKDGNRIDGEDSDVVKKAIVNYLTQLPFNELYIPTYHIDYVQQVEGVKIPVIDWVKSSRYSSVISEESFTDIPSKGRVALAGWFKFEDEENDIDIVMLPFSYGEI